MRSLLQDVGVSNMKVLLCSGASAALSVVERKGVGWMRYINTNFWWLEEKRFQEQVTFVKVGGKQHPAALCTKHVDRILSRKHMDTMSVKDMGGRAPSAAQAH